MERPPFKGSYWVQLTNEDVPKVIDIDYSIENSHAIPLYLIATDGHIYNWMNIVWIKKVDN